MFLLLSLNKKVPAGKESVNKNFVHISSGDNPFLSTIVENRIKSIVLINIFYPEFQSFYGS